VAAGPRLVDGDGDLAVRGAEDVQDDAALEHTAAGRRE